jgi:1,4-alpha-glucan branching enzyme
MTHPGKKLLFMGNELASYDEWHFEGELPWSIKKFPLHDSAQKYMKDLTTIYKKEKALWEEDFNPKGFNYIEANNADQSIYIYARFAEDPKDHIIVVMNCTPNTYSDYRIGVIGDYMYEEIINSDKYCYNGSDRINPIPITVSNEPYQKQPNSMLITVPPLGIALFKPIYKKEKSTTIKKSTKSKDTKKVSTKKSTKK